MRSFSLQRMVRLSLSLLLVESRHYEDMLLFDDDDYSYSKMVMIVVVVMIMVKLLIIVMIQ
jgi:hypothetical protein